MCGRHERSQTQVHIRYSTTADSDLIKGYRELSRDLTWDGIQSVDSLFQSGAMSGRQSGLFKKGVGMWATAINWIANMESGMSIEQCEYHLVCPWKDHITQHLSCRGNVPLCQTAGHATL